MEVRNKRLDRDEFLQMRKEVLATWPTGREVDLDEAIEYHRKLPRSKVLADLLTKAKAEGRTLLMSHGGRGLIDEHIRLLKAMQEAGSDCLPSGIDSNTRNNKYEEAGRVLAESEKAGRSLLNGLPVVNHGVKSCRKVTEAVDQPIMTRTLAPDSRLVAEISLASGFTGFDAAGICSFTCYARDASLASIIRNFQYVNTLTGLYEEAGVPIVRELPRYVIGGGGWMPCIDVVVSVCEALLTAEQGVKHILLQNVPQLNIQEAVAMIRVSERMTNEYLQRSGYSDVKVFTFSGVWPGAFPADKAKSWAAIIHQAVIGALAGVQVHFNGKTVDEAYGLPSIEAHAESTRACRQLLDMLRGQRYPDSDELRLEMRMLELEARSILDRVFDLGEGDVAVGLVRAFEAGAMDVPFSPNRNVRCKVMPARDATGAVRFLDTGNLPFPAEVKEFHRQKLAERGRIEGREPCLEMMIDDVIGGLASVAGQYRHGH